MGGVLPDDVSSERDLSDTDQHPESASTMLPPDVDEDNDLDAPSSMDMACPSDIESDVDTLADTATFHDGGIFQPIDVAEYFSPPRCVPAARDKGLTADMSLDIETGVDFFNPHHRQFSLNELTNREVQFLILCDRCSKSFYLDAGAVEWRTWSPI